MTKRCTNTLDLMEWEPPKLSFDAETAMLRAETIRDRIARAVSLVMRECELPRDEIARRMSAFLGEDVTLNMLDNYASQARSDATIPAHRLVALAEATGDHLALQVLVAPLDLAVIPSRFVPAIEDAILDDKIEELNRRRAQARRAWKGPRP
jgi:hypothetical protein